MLLIAIDTSGRNGGVALCKADAGSFAALEAASIDGGTYSARLVPVITELLVRHNIRKEQIDAFVVVSGPGSFTGLRVGLATVKGLCDALNKPLVPVSMLEAVAVVRGGRDGRLLVGLEAGRGEVYVGEFELASGRATLVREQISKLAALAEEVRSIGSAVITPDDKVAETLIAAAANGKLVTPLQPGEIGRFGFTKLQAGEVADAATLDANYIRRSDAEIFSAPK